MRQARQVIAVALVATALCADRAASAAPSLKPHALPRTGGIVSRLTTQLGRAVRHVTFVEARREGSSSVLSSIGLARAPETGDLLPQLRLSDPQLPLPPPVL